MAKCSAAAGRMYRRSADGHKVAATAERSRGCDERFVRGDAAH